jgi:hypothetical protein
MRLRMSTTNLPSTWNIGLSAWIIQDGNCPDFVVNQTVEFAVEYYQESDKEFRPTGESISATHVDDSAYDVVAERVVHTPELTVLDIGILIYRESDLSQRREPIENRLRRLFLSVDHFSILSGSQSFPLFLP